MLFLFSQKQEGCQEGSSQSSTCGFSEYFLWMKSHWKCCTITEYMFNGFSSSSKRELLFWVFSLHLRKYCYTLNISYHAYILMSLIWQFWNPISNETLYNLLLTILRLFMKGSVRCNFFSYREKTGSVLRNISWLYFRWEPPCSWDTIKNCAWGKF